MNWVRVAIFSRDGKRRPCRLYNIWVNMRVRCYNPTRNSYAWYGALGIGTCDEWEDYAAFRAWALAHGYRKSLTLDRIDGKKDYAPGNCRWATRREQQRNTKRQRLLTHNGVTKPVWAWVGTNGLTESAIRGRLQQRWLDEHVLTIPMGSHRPPEFRKKPGRRKQISLC